MIEGVQGEGGVTPATPEYLLGLRALCDEKKLLLFMDGVQCGHYRTGKIPEFSADSRRRSRRRTEFLPDGVSMAKSLGGGFPIGAFWVRAPYADLLGPGTHATTFGGTPLACAVALKMLEVIERERLDEHARKLGEWLKRELERLATNYPQVVKRARGLGFMLGLELVEKEKIPALAASDKTAAIQFVNRLHADRRDDHSGGHANCPAAAAAESQAAGSRRRHRQN